ncbi:MAG: hypothetical protein U5J64_11140 [Halobacteriales archaeon]|nr:hypothetical protein [Halobacteriales archaeon]
MSTEGVTYEQVRSAVMRAVDQAKESLNQIESEYPTLADFPEFELKNDGIDLGRDGNVTPWSRTPWTGGFDFREKTTVTVSGIQLPDETLKITARPDSFDRGIGWNFVVTDAETGESPSYFERLLISSVEDSFGLREQMSRYVENNYLHLKDDGGGDGETDPAPTPPSMEVVEELGSGWVLVVKRPGSQSSSSSEYLVFGKQGGSEVYLNAQGEVIDEEHLFASKKRARKAYRRWRDRREGNISEARSELNETMRARAEKFETLEEQQEQQSNVVTESNVVEGDTKVVEGDSQTVKAGSGTKGKASSAGSPSITLPEMSTIPVAGVAVVVLGVLYMVIRDTEAT